MEIKFSIWSWRADTSRSCSAMPEFPATLVSITPTSFANCSRCPRVLHWRAERPWLASGDNLRHFCQTAAEQGIRVRNEVGRNPGVAQAERVRCATRDAGPGPLRRSDDQIVVLAGREWRRAGRGRGGAHHADQRNPLHQPRPTRTATKR